MSAAETSSAEQTDVTTISLSQFVDELSSKSESFSLSALQDLLKQVELTPAEMDLFVNFDKTTYQRNLVVKNENFEVLLLCFEAGQRTPIHDHAGSACGVKVIKGLATETQFTTSDGGWLYATGSCDLEAPGVVGSVDMDIHQLSNLQGNGRQLITLHVYSPPLGEVGNYSIIDNSVVQVKAKNRTE